MQPLSGQIYQDYAINQCPDNPQKILTDCGDNVPCLYDYTMMNAEILGRLNVEPKLKTIFFIVLN